MSPEPAQGTAAAGMIKMLSAREVSFLNMDYSGDGGAAMHRAVTMAW